MIKKIFLILTILIIFPLCSISADRNYIGLMKIDPEKNAYVHNNLGETYLKLGYYEAAQDCFENALDKYPLNFRYYLNLVTSYQMQGLTKSKLKYYQKNKKTPLDDITIGILYIADGQTDTGIAVLERFVMNEPKLFITDGVKYYLKGIIEERKDGKR